MNKVPFSFYFKRIIDLFIAAILLTILSPLMILTAIIIFLTMGRPILFTGQRAGRYGKSFRLFKFRTMRHLHAGENALDKDYLRITPLGKFLRSTSIDELPQLVNVLLGDISLVGPRPLLLQYNSRYTKEQSRRLSVPPGITGWAQVNGRNAISWDEKFRLDTWYVDHWNIWLDLKIILMTSLVVFTKKGIQQGEQTTMTEFMGSNHLQNDKIDLCETEK